MAGCVKEQLEQLKLANLILKNALFKVFNKCTPSPIMTTMSLDTYVILLVSFTFKRICILDIPGLPNFYVCTHIISTIL